MAEYTVKTPDGGTITVRAPDDASKDQVLRFAKMQYEQRQASRPEQQTAQQPETPPTQPESLNLASRGLTGIGETALSLGSGIAGQVAGGLRGIGNLVTGSGGEQAAQSVQETAGGMTYQPRGQAGQQITQGIGGLFAPIEEGLQEVGGRVTDDPVGTLGGLMAMPLTGRPQVPGSQQISQQIPAEVRAALGTATRLAPEIAGTFGGSRFLRPSRQAQNFERGTKGDTLARAEAEGFTALPSQVADVPGVNRGGRAFLENLTKHAEVRRMATARNQNNFVNPLAARALGLDKDRLTPADLAAVRKEANQAYSDIPKALERVDIDQDYMRDVLSLRSQKNQSFPAKINQEIDDLVVRLTQSETPRTQDSLSIIRELRDSANVNLKPSVTKPEQIELGYAQRRAADAVEEMIGRNLQRAGRTEELERFRQARQRLAKAHTVENAMNEGTSNIDPRVILRDKRKGVPLSDELDLIADTAAAFPDVMKATEAGVSARPFTATDLYFLSGSAAYGLGGMNPSALIPIGASLAAPAGRMAALRTGTPTRAGFVGAGRGAQAGGLFNAITDEEFQQMSGLMGR